MKASTLLKQATQLKRDGELEEAIEIIKYALQKIEEDNEVEYYGWKTFLRLPNYLRDLGRFDNSWNEYNKLLLKNWGGKEINPMAYSEIYKSMSLQLLKEKKYEYSLKHEILSILFWCRGLKLQKREIELFNYNHKYYWDDKLKKHLKKLNQKELPSNIFELIETQILKLPKLNIKEFSDLFHKSYMILKESKK